MSKQRDVADAVLALVKRALPECQCMGLEDGADRPKRIDPIGSVFVRDGDPGEPEIDLSPPTYHYEHRLPVELAAYKQSVPLRTVLDRMAGSVGDAVLADRSLGGLVDWLDVTAATFAAINETGSQTQMGATFDVIAHYSTTNPLN